MRHRDLRCGSAETRRRANPKAPVALLAVTLLTASGCVDHGPEAPWLQGVSPAVIVSTGHSADAPLRWARCSAVAIDGGPVLTAAHCLSNEADLPVFVLVDPSDLCSEEAWGGPGRKVGELVARDAEYDIAALVEADAIDSASGWVRRLRDVVFDPPVGTELMAVGWGSLSPEGPRECEARLERQMVVAPEQCESAGLRLGPKICVRDSQEDATGVCQGFSGGPVFALADGQWVLAGLSSTGIGCGANNLGTVAPLSTWVASTHASNLSQGESADNLQSDENLAHAQGSS